MQNLPIFNIVILTNIITVLNKKQQNELII